MLLRCACKRANFSSIIVIVLGRSSRLFDKSPAGRAPPGWAKRTIWTFHLPPWNREATLQALGVLGHSTQGGRRSYQGMSGPAVRIHDGIEDPAPFGGHRGQAI